MATELAGHVPVVLGPDGRFTLEPLSRGPQPEAFLAQSLRGAQQIALPGAELAARQPVDANPTGLMIHPGRSGSTLLCRMLDAVTDLVTYREPPVMGDVLERSADPGSRGPWTVTALRQFAWHGAPRRTVVKLDSASTAALINDAVTDELAGAPVVALVRDPVAVAERLAVGLSLPTLAALEATVGLSAVTVDEAGAATYEGDLEPLVALAEQRIAEVRTAVAIRPGTPVVDFDDFLRSPLEVVEAVAAHLGGRISASDPVALIDEVLARHSKTGAPFSGGN